VITIHYLTPQLRKELKKPLGYLIHGSLDETMMMMKSLIKKEKPIKIITVGDRVSQDLTDHTLQPDVLIIDNKIMRKEIPPISASADKIMNVPNPAGTITDEAWSAIEKAARSTHRIKIIVDGEEDLLTLVAILTMPDNSLICYGQPHEGIVAVKTTPNLKKKIRKIVDAMKRD
jgi:uncharacterized protein (UPF0218 family)